MLESSIMMIALVFARTVLMKSFPYTKMSPSVLLPSFRVGIAVIAIPWHTQVSSRHPSKCQSWTGLPIPRCPCRSDTLCSHHWFGLSLSSNFSHRGSWSLHKHRTETKFWKKGAIKGRRVLCAFRFWHIFLKMLLLLFGFSSWMLLHLFFHFSCFFAWCIHVSLFLRSFP